MHAFRFRRLPAGFIRASKEPIMNNPSLLASFAAACLLGACATTQPFSQLDGYRWNKAGLNTYDVTIISVDGEHYIQRGVPIVVAPGEHKVVVQGPRSAAASFGSERTLTLNVEPCTRYWLEARKSNPLGQDFEPAVNYKEPIAGCGRG
jgi:hypothetical protein